VVVEPERRSQSAAEEGMRAGGVWAAATCLARDLVNEPANVVTPAFLAKRAQEIARSGRLGLKVLERDDCQKLGMGAYVGVAQGSLEPPKFIHLTYRPKQRARKRVVVIGKGITFDSGGLDLKPADGMYRMKDDMSGAAAVLGLFSALPKLALPVEVHGLIAATENMPSGTAQRPGDIVRAMNGLTIEIGNTDAEGRLTLADALVYADKEIKPDEMVDLATLTGAIVVALGMGLSGVFVTDDGLAERMLGAAETAGEKMWRMPLHDEYKDGIKSDIADLNNISSQRGGGAIVAGLFMRDFTGGRPWAHLDIAGTAFTERELPLGPKGATGVGVRTLLAYLHALAGRR
jgi:leucyl aminopeptidase